MTELSLDDLRDELSDFAKPRPKRADYTPQQERVIAGFEDIVRFHDEHGRAPIHGESRDIFERLYAVRLERLRSLDEFHEILAPLDEHKLLEGKIDASSSNDAAVDTDALLNELKDVDVSADITKLTHVVSREERRAAEEVANRERCADFDKFEPLFEQVQKELDQGVRSTRPFELKAEIRPGAFFIVNGQIAYVVEMGEVFKNDQTRQPASQCKSSIAAIFMVELFLRKNV